MWIESVVRSPNFIDLYWWHNGLCSYWIPLDRKGESDWPQHVSRKKWMTEAMIDGLDLALTEARNNVEPKVAGVYCLKEDRGTHWKIGMSANVYRRMADVAMAAPFETVEMFTVACADPRATEKRLLDSLSDFKAHGEWFEMVGDDIESFVAALELGLGDVGIRPASDGFSQIAHRMSRPVRMGVSSGGVVWPVE